MRRSSRQVRILLPSSSFSSHTPSQYLLLPFSSPGDSFSELQTKLTQQTAELECFSKLIVSMAAMRCGLPHSERLLLQSYLCPILQEGSEQVRLP